MISFFKSKEKEEYTIIIGCGRLGAKIANTMSNNEENVLVIDKSESSYKRLSSEFGGINIFGDGMDIATLKEAEIEKASVLVAVTDDDNTNIMVAQIAKTIFNVPRVIARLYDPEKACVFEGQNIDIVCPAMLSADNIYNILDNPKTEEGVR